MVGKNYHYKIIYFEKGDSRGCYARQIAHKGVKSWLDNFCPVVLLDIH